MTSFEMWRPGDEALEPAPNDLAAARAQIEAAALVGAAQERQRAEVLAFCDRHGDALHRTCRSGHLTGSAVVVDPATESTLLIHHAKLERWLQPGGHADGDGNLGAVAWREATEETGLEGLMLLTPAVDVDIHAIPARGHEPEHLHLDLRHVVLVGASKEAAPNHETLGARWLRADAPELADPTRTEPELARMITRAVEVAAAVVSG